MARRGRSLRMLLGMALGLSMGVTVGCLQDEDFVGEYATELCGMVRDCGVELTLPNATEPLPATSMCEALIEAHYSTCASDCFFRRSKARRCLRRLRDNQCTGEDEPGTLDTVARDADIPGVCHDVFGECDGGFDQEDQCAAPTTTCSVTGRGGASSLSLPFLGLLLLGLRRRRLPVARS